MQKSHSHFFSSLKQLEKRLKLDDNPTPAPAPAPAPTQSAFSSPLYLYEDTTNNIDSITTNSETPQAFLSNSTNIFQETPCQQVEEEGRVDDNGVVVDEIELLMQELNLSKRVEVDFCDDEFYGKIVRAKGPKCQKEVERLEGWIEHFHSGDDRRLESLRLAHLLLGKASLLHSNVEFPSTIDEFLHKDPPSFDEVASSPL